MKKIEFSKLTGQGNDFILIDSTKKEISFSDSQIKLLCDRHFGIGADGIIIIRKSKSADLFMDYYNSDGTLAEMCGNGIRCMARFAFEKNIIEKEEINIETRAGLKKIKFQLIKNKTVGLIEVDMGAPIFEAEKIPVDPTAAKEMILHKEQDDSYFGEFNTINDLFFRKNFNISGKTYELNCISMGNPHCVIFIAENENLEDIELEKIGPAIENFVIFPKKTNVEFIKIGSANEIGMRVWERGCGETLACGTGACASAAASIVLGKIKPKEVIVNLKGGILFISWSGKASDSVFLKGKVDYVFDGEYFLDNIA
ncbi:MAG: diaminopimelate epimerase [Actinomycetota bacterium]|nr:diaminopimelate epimerase [Actinomycetota bacterium]